MPDQVKPSFVTFDIQALWRSAMSVNNNNHNNNNADFL